MRCNGYNVWIKSASKESSVNLIEYGHVKIREENTVSCWIATENKKNFSINWKIPPSELEHKFQIYVDGTLVDDFVHSTTSTLRDGMMNSKDRSGAVEGVLVDQRNVQPFAFSNTKFTGKL